MVGGELNSTSQKTKMKWKKICKWKVMDEIIKKWEEIVNKWNKMDEILEREYEGGEGVQIKRRKLKNRIDYLIM